MKIFKAKIVYQFIREGEPTMLNSPADIVSYLQRTFDEYPAQEQFVVVPLSRKLHPVDKFRVALGTLTSCPVHPREVFKPAILAGADSLVVAHNHPSGDPSPGKMDSETTKRLFKAGQLLGIELTDHVIVGQKSTDPNGVGYFSFHESGKLSLYGGEA